MPNREVDSPARKYDQCRCGGIKSKVSEMCSKCRYPKLNVRYQAEYRAWAAAKSRCYDRNCCQYQRYGGRGIQMCSRLRNSFSAFLAMVQQRPASGYQLDRKDNDGNYSCGECEQCRANGWTKNVRWVTAIEQSHNRRNNTRLTHDGKTMVMMDWARHLNIDVGALRGRIQRWGVDLALSTPGPKGKPTTAATGYRGVYKRGNRYQARIRIRSVDTNLGMFATAEDAALAYNRAATAKGGPCVILNEVTIPRRRIQTAGTRFA